MIKKMISLALCVVLALSFFIPVSALSVTDVLGLVYCSSGDDVKGVSHCISFNITETHYILSVIPVEEDYSYSCIFHDLSGKAKVNYDGRYFTVLTMRKSGLKGFDITEETVNRGDTVDVYYYNVENYEDAASLNTDNLIKKTVTVISADNGLYEISQELDPAAEGGLVVNAEGTCIGIVANSQNMKHVIGFSYVINEILKNHSTENDIVENDTDSSDGDGSGTKDNRIGNAKPNIFFWIISGVILLAFIALIVIFIIRRKRTGSKRRPKGSVTPPVSANFGDGANTPTPIPANFGDGANTPMPLPVNFSDAHNMPTPPPNNFDSLNMSTPTLDNFGGGLNRPMPVPDNFAEAHQIPAPAPNNFAEAYNTPAPVPENFAEAHNIPTTGDFAEEHDTPTPTPNDFVEAHYMQTPDPDDFEDIQDIPSDRICIGGEKGYFDGQVFELTGTVTIGRRSSRCNIHYPADQKGISGVHCQLRRVDSQLEITDLSSSYGTFVNGIKLTPNVPVKLSVGDKFWLANQENCFIVYE